MKSTFAFAAAFALCLFVVACGDDAMVQGIGVHSDDLGATDDVALGDGNLADGVAADVSTEPDLPLWELPPAQDVDFTDVPVVGKDADTAADSAVTDADGTGDVLPDTLASCPGGDGCPCTVDADCSAITICADTANGKQCLVPCASGTACANDTACVNIPGPDTLTTDDDKSVCAPKFPHLCDPCTASTPCPSVGMDKVACIGLGTSSTGTDSDGAAGWYCSNFCLTDSDCPSEYACLSANTVDGDTATFCRPKTNTCTCSAAAIASKASTTCASGKTTPDGTTITGCKGARTCDAAGLSACSAPVPVTETCDNVDNDCNGVTDDGLASMCDDKNGCTSDLCQGGICLALPIAASCDDGNLCTTSDMCSGSKCGGVAVDCDDKNACTTDTCDSAIGCVHVNTTDACEDGDACTTGDTCKDGACISGSTNSCQCASDADCAPYEDGNKCNGTLYCAKAASPFVCKVNPVTVVTCNPANDTLCSVNTCTPGDGTCAAVAQNNGKSCDDSNVCTTGEICADTTCTPQGSLPCNDDNDCTNDSCDPVSGCGHVLNTVGCSDGNACTSGDVCGGGACAGSPVDCNDGFACTADSCDPIAGCVNKPLSGDVCQISSGYSEPFNCGSSALDLWQRSDALLTGGAVKWDFDATPAVPAPQSAGCTMNINNGTNLKCGTDQAAIAATVDSPSVDLSAMATGTTTKLTFYSAGIWTASKAATVAIQIDAGSWSDLGTATTSPTWSKVTFSSTSWAGHKLRFRFSFAGPCDGDSNVGWFIDDFAVFEDLCTTTPGVCGANSICDMDVTGQLNCTICPGGYVAQNGSCIDVDECANGTAGCAAEATCANLIGSYACTCKAGYTGDGKTCADIDECATGKSNCAANATCANTPGSFTCTCPAGTVGNGVTCGALGSSATSPAISCLAIYQVAPKSTDGVYWLNFTGTAGQYYCDMKNGGWTRLIADDFENSQGGWSQGAVDTCGKYGHILGGYKQFGKGAAPAKTVAAPPHTQAKLWLQYIRLDAWANNWAIVGVDGNQVWSQQAPWSEWAGGWNNKCGRWDYQDDEWDLGNGWVGAHSAATVTVSATSTLDQGADAASFGLDNVILYVK
jgi:hypothetical protein